MRILLVDDERDAAALIAKGLREHGPAVDVAHDGRSALERVGVNDHDLVVLDVMLPGANGLQICRAIRRRGLLMPILILPLHATILSSARMPCSGCRSTGAACEASSTTRRRVRIG